MQNCEFGKIFCKYDNEFRLLLFIFAVDYNIHRYILNDNYISNH